MIGYGKGCRRAETIDRRKELSLLSDVHKIYACTCAGILNVLGLSFVLLSVHRNIVSIGVAHGNAILLHTSFLILELPSESIGGIQLLHAGSGACGIRRNRDSDSTEPVLNNESGR